MRTHRLRLGLRLPCTCRCRCSCMQAGRQAAANANTTWHLRGAALAFVRTLWGWGACRFTGTAGVVVVTADAALLWTDGRYFLQVAE